MIQSTQRDGNAVKDSYDQETKVAVIGAGPIGIETAIELQKAGVDFLHFDKGQIGSTIMRYPPGTVYFSSPERICIAGIPIPNVGVID